MRASVRARPAKPSKPLLLDASGKPLFAQYVDSAATTRHNQAHWRNAQFGDVNQLIQRDLATLRRRARYEIVNNAYAAGIIDTLAMYLVGSGPRPQCDSGNEDFDQEVEDLFCRWAAQCDYEGQTDLAELLQMQLAHQPCEAGESITLLIRDAKTPYGVSLRLLAVDAERLVAPQSKINDPNVQDGIEFDDKGRPVAYYIAKRHPAQIWPMKDNDIERVAADDVIHFFRKKRPGQTRGIPWIAPALDLFAQLRRFTLATLDAAETAATITGTLEAEGFEPDPDEAYMAGDVIELERRALLLTPPGYRMNQVKPEHPSTTFEMFQKMILNEIARCFLMPLNVALGNSADLNYASGRLDHQQFYRFIETARDLAAARVLRRIFAAWMQEAYLIDGLFTTRPTFEQALRAIETVEWFWPGFKHVDPVKEANAEQIRLQSGTITLEDCYAEQGFDWKRKLQQRAREIAYMRQLGLPLEDMQPKQEQNNVAEEVNDDENQKDD